MAHPKSYALLAIIFLCYSVSECNAQQWIDANPAFTLSYQITNYDVSGNVLSSDSATRYQSSRGDWRYAFRVGNNALETISVRGQGVYFGDSTSGRLIRMTNSAALCPAVSAEALRRDKNFVRTETVLGFTAYVLQERISSYVMETYFVPELKRIPFKRTYVFEDGHRNVEEPTNITMGEPSQTDLLGPDYARIEQVPIFNNELAEKALSQPPPISIVPVKKKVDIVVQVIVDEAGRVVSARAITPIPILDVAARNAAYQAFFSPTVVDGKVVVATGVITYTFNPPAKIEN